MFSFFVQYLLGLSPVWFWPLLMGLSIGIFFILDVIPLAPNFKIYVPFAKIACVVVLLLSTFLFGGAGVKGVYEQKKADNEHTVELGKQASKDATQQVDSNLAGKQENTKTKTVYVTRYIHDNTTQINSNCSKISDSAWEAYNHAVTGDVK